MSQPLFPLGTFSPDPQPASISTIVRAQGAAESKLMLRHGEQLLLSVVIPLTMLVVAATMGAKLGFGLESAVPMVFAVSASSAGFTGQAISVAFDRRYGALKRTGASGVPSWAIILGKIIAVASMVAVQVVILGTTAAILGFHATVSELAGAAVVLALGVGAFTALGLLLGGTLSSELVLALANLLWFVLLGAVGFAVYEGVLGNAGLLTLVPTVALAGGLADALQGTVPIYETVVLLGWTLISIACATKWFRFEG